MLSPNGSEKRAGDGGDDAGATPPRLPANTNTPTATALRRQAGSAVAQATTPLTPPPTITATKPPQIASSNGSSWDDWDNWNGTGIVNSADCAASTSPTPSARHDRLPPRHEPGSSQYLTRLLRLAKRQVALDHQGTTAPRRTPPAMADFLAGFNLAADNPAPSNSGQWASVDELALYLRDVLTQKTTEFRADHVSVTLELRNSVQFPLSLSESENAALEDLSNIDPSLGGLRSASNSVDPAGGQAMRVVDANHALMNQSDNPVLQRTIAKHILGAISATDGSSWNLRDLSRGAQGWKFTYICRDSLQHWSRQHAKQTDKAILCEYSMQDPDPDLLSRPAFDCRGSITITFNRSSRLITVKYDHTLLHKTVDELRKHYPPPERNPGPGYQRQQEQKDKAQQKTPKKPRGEKRPRKNRESNVALDENGERPKKRKRKRKAKDQAAAQDGPVMPPDYPGAAPADGQDALYGALQTVADSIQGAQGDRSGQSQQAGPSASGVVSFNVSSEEAARRLDIARRLLNDAGVNPDTLSADQMNIFANQSPELQKDSVAMLAKYGAERLQIIHPNNKDKTSSEQSSGSATPATQTAMSSNMTTTKELAPGAQSSGATSSGRKRKPTAEAANDQATEGTPSTRRIGKSRVACFQCKSRKVKCPKERPSCSECQSEGQTCEYPPQRPQKKKSEAIVTVDDDEPDEDEEQKEGEQHPQPEEPTHNGVYHPESQQAVPQDPQDMAYPQMPVSDMLTPNAPEARGSDPSYFQSAPGLILPQPPQPGLANVSGGLAMPQGQDFANVTDPQLNPGPDIPQTTSPKQSKSRPTGGSGAPRRSLPASARGSDMNRDDQSMNLTTSGSWAGTRNPSSTTAQNPAAAGLAPQAARGQQRSRQSNGRAPTDPPQMRESTSQPASSKPAAVQQVPPVQQSPTMVAAMQAQARTSPFQAAGHQRTHSRQSQRTQSDTPNADQSTMARGFHPPAQTQPVNQGNNNDLVASSNYNNYGRYLGTNVAAEDQQGNRIAYEPISQQQTTAPAASSYPAYEYGRGNTSSTTMAAQSFNPSNSNMTNSQWSGSQTQSTRSSYDKSSGYNTAGPYTQAPASGHSSASLHNFDMRASAQKRSSAGAATAMNKQQQQQQSNYPPYPSQSQSHDQQMGQHGSWNYFGSNGQGWL